MALRGMVSSSDFQEDDGNFSKKKQGTQEKEDSGKETVVDRNGQWWCD